MFCPKIYLAFAGELNAGYIYLSQLFYLSFHSQLCIFQMLIGFVSFFQLDFINHLQFKNASDFFSHKPFPFPVIDRPVDASAEMFWRCDESFNLSRSFMAIIMILEFQSTTMVAICIGEKVIFCSITLKNFESCNYNLKLNYEISINIMHIFVAILLNC